MTAYCRMLRYWESAGVKTKPTCPSPTVWVLHHNCCRKCNGENSSILWTCGASWQPLHNCTSRPNRLGWVKEADWEDAGLTTTKIGLDHQWRNMPKVHRTDQHGEQRCHWLRYSTLRIGKEQVHSGLLHRKDPSLSSKSVCSIITIIVSINRHNRSV